MTYRILTKKNGDSGVVPDPSELLPGELALNYHDMILFALDDGGNVRQVSSSGGGGGGDLVAMDYTFWVKVIPEDATGQDLMRFRGPDDAGRPFDPNLEGFDVGLNGVSLIPDYNDGQGNFIDGDYSLDSTALDLHEPAKPGDVVIIRSLKASDAIASGQITTDNVALLNEDTTTPTPKGYKDWLARNGLQTQQDANWHLHHKIENLDIPEEFNPEGLVTEEELEAAIDPLASREWVLDQSYITEQPLTDAIDKVVQDQLEVDQRQDNEIQLLETRVSQIESVVWMLAICSRVMALCLEPRIYYPRRQ